MNLDVLRGHAGVTRAYTVGGEPYPRNSTVLVASAGIRSAIQVVRYTDRERQVALMATRSKKQEGNTHTREAGRGAQGP